MELDGLKNSWAALDKRLKKNNSLNETIILKMVQGKAEKSINRLLRSEIIGTILVILILPFIAYSIEMNYERMRLFWNLLMIASGTLCFFAIFWEIYKISILMKIDFSKEVSATIYHFNKYSILLKREFFIAIYIFVPILVTLSVLTYTEENASFSLWMFLSCMFILLIFTIWYSIKRYKRVHAAIATSLNEINEIKELKDE